MSACGAKCTPCFLIPQRYVLGIMSGFAIFNMYTMRVALSIAITEMVIKKNESLSHDDSDSCPIEGGVSSYVTVKNQDLLYDWDEATQGIILSSFFWSYIAMHIPGALIAEKVGAKHVIGISMWSNCILTLIFPIVLRKTNGRWQIVILLRMLMGLGQGTLYPGVTAMLAQWVPLHESGEISGMTYSGALLGTVFTNLLGGVLIHWARYWGIVFYFFGLVAVVWCVIWQLICYSYPRTHPCVKDHEREYLEKELAGHVSRKHAHTPWKEIMSSVPVWANIIGNFGHAWGWFTMVIDLPKYMNAVLRFNIQENGFWSALPYLLMWITVIGGGYLDDWIITKEYLSVAMTRKVLATIGHMGPAIFLMLASYVGCNRMAAVAMFSTALFFMGFFYPGIKVNALDLSPNYAGTIMALSNGIGVFAGMAAPAAVGFLAPNQTMSEWRLVFWVCFGMLAFTNVLYLLMMSGNEQPWNGLVRRPVEERRSQSQ